MARVFTKERQLADALFSAKSLKDLAEIKSLAKSIYGGMTTRPVGDRPNNIGTIRLGSDPALGLVERITNGMDSLLDLGHLLNPGDHVSSPREAARLWYGVPKGGLFEMTETERRKLAEKLQVRFEESGVAKRPTVVFEDRGTGQPRHRMPKTLLSLNEQNKVAQPWTLGTYGQGGAVTFGFSDATIIISRSHPLLLDGEDDVVSWTIVERVEDPTQQALPSYKYLVGSDNEVFYLDPALFEGFEHGSRIIHVVYDLQGLSGPFTTQPWQFFNSALFEPVLPFHLSGTRKNEIQSGSRVITGNAARLAGIERAKGDIEIAHADSFQLELGKRNGEVTFNYWVLRRPDGSSSSSDAAGGYVRADAAVSMTLFGQRQDAESRSWIKTTAMLPFLYKNMIVQITADALTPVGKSEIFTSTRERGTKSDLRDQIYRRLGMILREDPELKRLNHEEKERLLQKSTSATSDKVRQRLAQFIKTKLKDLVKKGSGGNSEGDEGRKKSNSGSKSTPRDTDDTHLPSVPTQLVFERDSVRIYQGAGGFSWVSINAKNGYLPEHDEDLSFTWRGPDPGDKVRLTMRSKLLGGKSRWFFEADGDAPLKTYIFEASLLTANGILTDTIEIVVATPPPGKPESSGNEPETGPRVQWFTKEDWADHEGADARLVGYVTEDDETIIWVNRNFGGLDKALSGRSLTPEQIQTRATRYQFPVACALWLQQDAVKKAKQAPDENYQKAELGRVAEAVLIAIDPDVDAAAEEGED